MASSPGSIPGRTVRLQAATGRDDPGVQKAIELGNTARATLGHMPFSGYYAAADEGTLLLAYAEQQLAGYALYALTRRGVRLTHLCVAEKFRKCGIATMLVEEISARHSDYRGIYASCRYSYNLGPMWIKLGFTQLGERPGRGKDAEPLIEWWRDHNHANLFTVDLDTVLVRAAVDMNVLRDLAEPGRPDEFESKALLADHLAGRLELVRTAALDSEIDAMEGAARARCARRAQLFARVSSKSSRIRDVESKLFPLARAVDPLFPRTVQDENDLRYVAEAIVTDLSVFITRDKRLIELFSHGAAQFGLRVMRPADVVIHIDELVRAESYRPADLLNTAYAKQLIGSGVESDLIKLANVKGGERQGQFQRKLRELALSGLDRVGVYDPSGVVVAIYSVNPEEGCLHVRLLRVADEPSADTLASQLIFMLRQQARDVETPIIRLTDSHMSPQVRTAALNDGFLKRGDELYAFVLDAVGAALDVEYKAVMAACSAKLLRPATLRPGMPAVVAAELERTWWPAKITDSELPTYIVAIQQAFSADLLGVPSGLLPRSDQLGMIREHVYYRRPGGITLQAPARLLWYMSEGGRTVPYPASIVACSQLDAVVYGPPEELHSRFQHLGVWDIVAIQRAIPTGEGQALRFTNTEVFPNKISRDQYRKLAREHGLSGQPPQGPLRISPDLFAAIYREGRGH